MVLSFARRVIVLSPWWIAHIGLSRGAIQKAKTAERPVLDSDGSINAAASDVRRAANTDPSKPRALAAAKLKQVPEAAVAGAGDRPREQGLAVPAVGGGTAFLQAKTANELLKAQERRIRLQTLKGECVDRARAETPMFRLARKERDAWVTRCAGAAALMAAELTAALGDGGEVEAALTRKVLEAHACARLDSLAHVRPTSACVGLAQGKHTDPHQRCHPARRITLLGVMLDRSVRVTCGPASGWDHVDT